MIDFFHKTQISRVRDFKQDNKPFYGSKKTFKLLSIIIELVKAHGDDIESMRDKFKHYKAQKYFQAYFTQSGDRQHASLSTLNDPHKSQRNLFCGAIHNPLFMLWIHFFVLLCANFFHYPMATNEKRFALLDMIHDEELPMINMQRGPILQTQSDRKRNNTL